MMKNLSDKLRKIKLSPKAYLNFPESSGVYVYFKNKKPIYIGKAINLKRRVSSYFNVHLGAKTAKLMEEAEEISYIKVQNELEALLLEAKLIKNFQPKFNIISKDDKHPLYIVITNETFPRIITLRKIDVKKFPTIAVYGPFPSLSNIKSVLKMLRKIFPYADHKIGKKPCLYSQIGLCNPCPNEIVNSTQYLVLRRTYLRNIKHIRTILDGEIGKVKKNLEREMKGYSNKEDFENAVLVRNKIKMLEYITNPNIRPDEYLKNPNLNEDVRKKEIDELKKILVKCNLHRIECFDVAHLSGASTAASMTTFIDGEPEKRLYRHFRIRQTKSQDDYASMREVSKRRIKHLNDWGRPDLIIVDGGKGQVSVFLREFEKEKIPIIGIAKKFETLIIPVTNLGTTEMKELRLPKGGALNLIQKTRNETHRFAQAYHHKLIKKSLFET